VAQRGSLAAAAQHLNLTATAVAQRTRALEDEIGADLVARSGRTARPTEAGHAVLARAEGVLAAHRSLRAAVTGQTIAGSLRIGAISTVLSGILPDVLMSFSRSDADLRIFLEPGTSSDLYDRTIAGHLDAAAVVKPSFDLPKAWDFQTWRREKLVLLIPSNETRTDIGAILGDSPFIRYDRQQWGGVRHKPGCLTQASLPMYGTNWMHLMSSPCWSVVVSEYQLCRTESDRALRGLPSAASLSPTQPHSVKSACCGSAPRHVSSFCAK
jgi:DNA-binding transcriptional LysR family regulator